MNTTAPPVAPAVPCCRYCGASISIHQHFLPGHCGLQICAERHALDGARKRQKQKRAQHAAGLVVARQAVAAAIPAQPDTGHIQVATVPYQKEPIAPLPQERRTTFEQHLRDTVATARDADVDAISPTAPPAKPALPETVLNAACATCQGNCCEMGKDRNAFITVQTIQHLIAQRPDLSNDQIIDTYLGALPALSTEDACVFQSADGCALPRDWRANICNSFHCEALFEMAKTVTADGQMAIVSVRDKSAHKLTLHDFSTGQTDKPKSL